MLSFFLHHCIPFDFSLLFSSSNLLLPPENASNSSNTIGWLQEECSVSLTNVNSPSANESHQLPLMEDRMYGQIFSFYFWHSL